jgi:hypothetical protein
MTEYREVYWDYWRWLSAVEPWQACALSVGIEPGEMTRDRHDYSVGPGVQSMWGLRPSRLKANTLKEFRRRLTRLTRDIHKQQFVLDRNGRLQLTKFVVWMKARQIPHFPRALAELNTTLEEEADWKGAKKQLAASFKETEAEFERKFGERKSSAPDKNSAEMHASDASDRSNILDTAVHKAIESAGSRQFADVYGALRELAINGERPFTGEVTTKGRKEHRGALPYTDSQNKVRKFTRNALSKRLTRLKTAGKRR